MKFTFEVVIGMTVEIDAETCQIAERIAKSEWIEYVQEAWIEKCKRIPDNQRSLKDGR